jgi:hypothetical protein
MHHAPRGAARHSRRARLSWTRTLRRPRRSIRSARVIYAAARFAPSYPAAAAEPLVVAAFRLAETSAQREESTGSGAVAGARKISRGRAPPFRLHLHSLTYHCISRR